MIKWSGLNQERNLHRSSQNSSKQTCGWILMWVKTADALSLEEAFLWTPQWWIWFDCFTLKYQFQNHFEGQMASFSSPSVCSGSLIGERGQFWRKRRSRLLYGRNTCVYSTVITTVISAHLTVEGSKVAKIHKLRYLKRPNLLDLDQAVLCNTPALTLLKIIFHPNIIINSPSSRPKPFSV